MKDLQKKYDSHLFEEQYRYDGKDLGSYVSEKGTSFKIWSPLADKIVLNLYKTGDDNAEKIATYHMTKEDKGVFVYKTDKNLKNTYYTYTVDVLGETNEICDIYAKATGVNGTKAMVVELHDTNPEGFLEDSFYYDENTQPIIYELHVKDFSYDPVGGMKYRGKYLAFTEDTGKNTGINYLKDLGVTHVHILPMFDYGSVDEAGSDEEFNWGYDPVNYNVPEGSYSTNPYDGNVRIKELKEMVMALHKAGIGVIMDVVYNHTYNEKTAFQYTMPNYYYRMEEDGSFADASACGNETASERFMYRKFMIDSVMYWAKEYHLDGFRFDLMGVHDVKTMNLIRQELDTLPNGKGILMYGEPWFAEEPKIGAGDIPAIKDNLKYLDTNISVFSDDTRDAVKGSVFYEEEVGYVNGSPELACDIKEAVLAWTKSDEVDCRFPKQIISYVSAHDNFTLYDKLVLSMRNEKDFTKSDAQLLQINKLSATIIFTCAGGIFFQAGEEFARTKHGEGDSYKSSPRLNMLDWKLAEDNHDLVEFYKGLISFRKNSKVLMDKNINIAEKIVFKKQADENIVSFTILDETAEYFVAYNPYFVSKKLDLPSGDFSVVCDGLEFIKEEVIVNGKVNINASSGVIYKKK